VKLSKFNPEAIVSEQAMKIRRAFQIPFYHKLIFNITIITITILSIIITNKINKEYDIPTCLFGDTLDCYTKVTNWTIKLPILT
jgi:hypothetical protein